MVSHRAPDGFQVPTIQCGDTSRVDSLPAPRFIMTDTDIDTEQPPTAPAIGSGQLALLLALVSVLA